MEQKNETNHEHSDVCLSPISNYNQNPDEAMMWLRYPKSVGQLREHLKSFIGPQSIGLAALAHDMKRMVKSYAHPTYQSRVAVDITEHNLRDFLKAPNPSKLIEPTRLMVHAYMMIVSDRYRQCWGPFEGRHDDHEAKSSRTISPQSPTPFPAYHQRSRN